MTGICRNPRKPECAKARDRKRRAAARARRPERHCKICGGPLIGSNRTGICSNRDSAACMKARKQLEREADPRPRAHRIAIAAGDPFGLWTALEDYGPENRRILCRCECGTERRVDGGRLLNGRSTSCGRCRRAPRKDKPPYLRAGMIFGRLTLLEDVARCDDRAHCRCECAAEITAPAIQVKLGGTRSCGCIRREARRTHGFSRHPLYHTWKGMLDRCANPKNRSYGNYGGRGVTVCGRWHGDPWAFAEDIEREIGPRPEGKYENGRALYSLDRWPDNDGGYWCGHCAECVSKGQSFNVRWSTTSEQVINQRKVSALTHDVLRLTQERDAAIAKELALAARVAELEALLALRKRGVPAAAASLF